MTEEQRDAHLREALRHAPDAQVQPPPALSALILNEARAKARDAAVSARPARTPLAALWDWLARPSVAAGFAGVMAATLVGLMWWDQPMDEALPRRPAPAATSPIAPKEAPAPAAATPPVAQAPMAPPVPAPNTEAQRRAPEPPHPALRKALPAADKKAEVAAPAAPPPPAPVREETVARAAAGAAAAERATPAPSPIPAPAALALAPEPTAPAVADAAKVPSPVATVAAAGALAKSKSSDEARRLRSMAPADALSSNQAAAKSELKESRTRQEAEALPSIARLRAAIAAEPARWAWQRGNGPAQDMNDAVYAWLAQLDSATGNTWQASASSDAAPPLGPALRLLRDGRVTHSLRITERGVLWENGSDARLAELPAGQLNALRGTLDSATP